MSSETPTTWPPGGLDFIVDTHVHFWDAARVDLYPHLAPSVDRGSLGVPAGADIGASYGPEDHRMNVEATAVGRTVHINAMRDPKRFQQEAEMLEVMRSRYGFPQVWIGKIDLSSPDAVRSALASYEKFPGYRGVRVLAVTDWSNAALDVLAESLVATGRVLDLGVHPSSATEAVRYLDRHPGLSVVIEHAGWPEQSDVSNPSTWRSAVEQLSACRPSPHVKISGMAMALQTTDAETYRPWIVHVLDAFGADRAMYGSNFPVDSAVVDYLPLGNVCSEVVAQWGGENAVRRVFRDTALSFYGPL
ncbi:amidohydrolase family protein [Streptomyces sp. NPDC097610]|uniref:amidohydrolase family protein n=1 Tax=Streptomyces sp. NPDC097610 TaxID=3157227 RepID=UPI0033226083